MAQKEQMTLLEHLEELRRRLFKSAVALLLCTGLCFVAAYEPLKLVLRGPLDALDPQTTNPYARHNPVVQRLRPYVANPAADKGDGATRNVKLHQMRVTETFSVKFKLCALAGFILGAPYLLYQVWAFIGAGLLPRERRMALTYLPLSVGLFAAGTLFAYFVAMPLAMLFLLTVDPDIEKVLMYGEYFSMLVMAVGMFGLAFQLPLVTMALARLGIVRAQTLRRSRRYAIVLIFVAAAILTPSPEPFSQCLLAIPMLGLFELGIWLAAIAERKRTA